MTASTTAGVDRTPKPCTHPRAGHKHGTHLAYDKDGCRCLPCVSAASQAGHLERYRTATGTHSYVAAATARAHVTGLLEVLTVSQIEQRSNVHRTAIRVLIGDFPGRPASRRITKTTEVALLAVEPDRLGTEEHGLVDGTGTRRRIRALFALGWPMRHLQQRLPLGDTPAQKVVRPSVPENTPVRVTTREAVRRLYDELSLTPPPPSRAVTRARALAAARGWPPPMAWDDDSIDDPTATPQLGDVDEDLVDELAVEAVLDGHRLQLSGATLHAAVLALAAAGRGPSAIADRLGIHERQVERLRGRDDAPRQYRRGVAA